MWWHFWEEKGLDDTQERRSHRKGWILLALFCWNLSFREQKCWFIHGKVDSHSNTSEYICNFYEQTCRNQSEFFKLSKTKHSGHVPTCNKSKDGECKYGKENCWFNHETEKLNNEKEKDSENANIMNKNGNEVIQRIMQIIETMTKRIMYLEIKT